MLTQCHVIFQRLDDFFYNYPRIKFLFIVGLSILGLMVLVSKSLFLQVDTVDFKYIWLAGHIWNDGGNPYSPLFGGLGGRLFVGYNHPTHWVYPPHIWPLSSLFALFDYQEAMMWWRTFNAGLILLGVYILVRTLIKTGCKPSLERSSILLFFVCAMSATAINLTIGQTSSILFFSVTVFIYAFLTQNRVVMIVAIYLLMLKPQVGLIFCFFLLPNRFWFSTLFFSTLLVILLSLRPLFIDDPLVIINNYLGFLSDYPNMVVNQAVSVTGLRHFVYLLTDVDLPPLVFISVAISGAVSLTVWGLWQGKRNPDDLTNIRYRLLIGILVIVFVCIPMHTYDSMIVAPLILLVIKRSLAIQIATALLLLMIFRSSNLAALTGLYPPENKYSIGSSIEAFSGVLYIGFLFYVWVRAFIDQKLMISK